MEAIARIKLLTARYNGQTLTWHPTLSSGRRTPAEIPGQGVCGHAPDPLPSPQPTIMKEPDSTSDW